MTTEQFMAEAAGYYGDYQPTVAKYVAAWFRSRCLDERTIAELWAEIIKVQSSSFRTPPDVAALEAGMRAVKARDDHRPDRVRLPMPEPNPADRQLAAEFLGCMVASIAQNRNPREDGRGLEIIAEVTGEQ